jgi:hypothetical protein
MGQFKSKARTAAGTLPGVRQWNKAAQENGVFITQGQSGADGWSFVACSWLNPPDGLTR